MTHEDFVKAARAALPQVPPPDLTVATSDSYLHEAKPWRVHTVNVWWGGQKSWHIDGLRDDDAILADLAGLVAELAGPSPNDLIGKGM